MLRIWFLKPHRHIYSILPSSWSYSCSHWIYELVHPSISTVLHSHHMVILPQDILFHSLPKCQLDSWFPANSIVPQFIFCTSEHGASYNLIPQSVLVCISKHGVSHNLEFLCSPVMLHSRIEIVVQHLHHTFVSYSTDIILYSHIAFKVPRNFSSSLML